MTSSRTSLAGAIIRTRLFLGAYAPLLLLLAVRFEDTTLALGALGLGGASLISLWRLLDVAQYDVAPDSVSVKSVSDVGAEVAGFLATYLLPFVTVAEPTTRDLIAYGAFFVIVGVIYVQSDMMQVNPTLYLLRRRIHKIETAGGWIGYVVAPKPVRVHDHLRKVSLAPNVMMALEVQPAGEG